MSGSSFLGPVYGLPAPLDPKADRIDRIKYWESKCREAFVVFETKEGLGIDKAAIPYVIQALGFNPTPELIREIESKLLTRNEDGMVPDDVNILLPNFLAIVPPMLADPQEAPKWIRDSYHKLVRAFAAFDPEGNGWVDLHELLRLLRDPDHAALTGPVFTDEELQAFLHACADPEGTRVYYEEFCLRLAEDGREEF